MNNELKIRKPYTKPVVNKVNVHRNDPCPCKSGKKYKNCCQVKIRLGLQKRVIDAKEKQQRES